MRTLILISITSALPLAAEAPPPIPSGDVSYDSVTYDYYSPYAPEDEVYGQPTYNTAPMPEAAPATYSNNGHITLNAYTSHYQVRGMGVTDDYSNDGYSSIKGSFTFPNRNLFNAGIEHRIFGEVGLIWDDNSILGDTPMAHLGYGIGKEIFPNLKVELAYNFRHGGLEGAMARYFNDSSNRFAQDLTFTVSFNDHQRGFFGHAMAGVGFQGLTGTFYDLELGYRLTDVAASGNYGLDVELSGGMSASIGYWGAGVEGVDAYRLRLAAQPYTQTGGMGRDGRFFVTPWVQLSWTDGSAGKIDRATRGAGPIDHFQICVGIDCGVKF